MEGRHFLCIDSSMQVTPQRILRAAGNRAEIAFRFLMRLFLPFDPWHRMPLAAKDYAVGIIEHLNSLPRNRRGRVADIGCGLGDVLLNLDFDDRLGLDNDPAVLKGAEIVRWSHFKGSASFAEFSFPEARLDGGFDAVIMVGWLHGIQPDPSKAGITGIFRDHVNPGGCLVIDTVSKVGYPYRHDADFLLGDLGGTVKQIGVYPCGRRVWKVIKEGAPANGRH
jgi:SAM-dependent methyltransferase